MPYLMGNVAHDVKALRETFGLTQREMALRLEITPAYLNDIEHGRRRISDERILACKVTAIRGALIGSRIQEYQTMIDSLRTFLSPPLSPRP